MKTLRIILAASLALASTLPAYAADRVLQSPRIKDNGDVRLSDDLKIGRLQNGKFVSTPDDILVSNLGAFTSFHKINLQHLQTVGADGGSVNFNRVSGVTGDGQTGNLNSTLRVINSVQNGDPASANNPGGRNQPGVWNGKPYEWAAGFLMENGRTFKADGYAGQNGAAYFRAKKTARDAGGTWAINAFAFDFPGLSNPTELTQAGEFDIHADGTDANRVRVGLSANIKSTGSQDGSPTGYGEAAYGFTALADPGFGAVTSRIWNGKWEFGFKAAGPMDVAFDAADTSTGSDALPFVTTNGTSTIASNANTPVAFRSSANQHWCFTKDKNFCLRSDASGTLQWAANPGVGGQRAVMQVDPYGNSVFGGNGSNLLLSGFTTQTIYNDGGSTMQRHHNGTIDMRTGVDALGFGYAGTASAHPFVMRSNGVEGARVTPAGRLSTPTFTPGSATTACSAGEIGWDTGFSYVCTATNTWKRTVLSTWSGSGPADGVTVKNYGAIADGNSHPVSQWVSSGRYANLAAIQVDYPHVTALTDEIDWAAVQAAANAPSVGGYSATLRLSTGKLVLNRDVVLAPGQRAVRGEGSGTTEVRFTGGTKGFTFENAGVNDRVQFTSMAVSTSQAGLGTAFTVSFSGTNSSTQQAVFQDINVLASGGYFKYGTSLSNVRSPAYNNVFVTGSLGSPGMLAAHLFRGTTTDIRFTGSFVLSALVGFDMGDLCEGLVLNDTIAIAVDTGVKANFPNGKPWVQINGGQIAAYKVGIDAFNAKQLHVIGTTMYAANYDPTRMANYVGIKLDGPDTRNVFVRGNYFQADGYVSPPGPVATTRAVMTVAAGAYGLVMDNQFSGFDTGVTLASGTNDWRVTNNMALSVTTPFADQGANSLYQNASAADRTVLGSGSYVEDISGTTAAQIRLRDRGAGTNLKGAAVLMDDGAVYNRLLNDDGSTKNEAISYNANRVRLGGSTAGTAALSTDYAGNTYLLVGGAEKLISVGAADSAGTGFRTLRIPN